MESKLIMTRLNPSKEIKEVIEEELKKRDEYELEKLRRLLKVYEKFKKGVPARELLADMSEII